MKSWTRLKVESFNKLGQRKAITLWSSRAEWNGMEWSGAEQALCKVML